MRQVDVTQVKTTGGMARVASLPTSYESLLGSKHHCLVKEQELLSIFNGKLGKRLISHINNRSRVAKLLAKRCEHNGIHNPAVVRDPALGPTVQLWDASECLYVSSPCSESNSTDLMGYATAMR